MAIPTRYPDAVWRPPPGMYVGPVRQKTDLVIWHVDAGNANSLYGWWNQAGSGQNGSHFFVKTDGTVEQYAPIDRITWTSGNGSIRSVGIETQGYAAGEWTPAQRAALIKLTRWLCKTLGVPMVMAPNSKLTSRGIAWHRQGVPATQAQKAAKVSQTGGELWSSSVGKVCPGPDREKQIPHMVGEIANQSIIDLNKPSEDDMPDINEIFNTPVFNDPSNGKLVTLAQSLTNIHIMANRNYDETPERVWGFPLDHTVAKNPDGSPFKVAAGSLLRYEPAEHESTRVALTAAITKAVAGIPGVDQKGLEDAISAVVKESLANSRIVFVPAPELEKVSDNA